MEPHYLFDFSCLCAKGFRQRRKRYQSRFLFAQVHRRRGRCGTERDLRIEQKRGLTLIALEECLLLSSESIEKSGCFWKSKAMILGQGVSIFRF